MQPKIIKIWKIVKINSYLQIDHPEALWLAALPSLWNHSSTLRNDFSLALKRQAWRGWQTEVKQSEQNVFSWRGETFVDIIRDVLRVGCCFALDALKAIFYKKILRKLVLTKICRIQSCFFQLLGKTEFAKFCQDQFSKYFLIRNGL